MDQGKVGILLRVAMSAAFETVDHRTPLDRLHTEIGTALYWFESYLVGDTRSCLFVVSTQTHACCTTEFPKDPS